MTGESPRLVWTLTREATRVAASLFAVSIVAFLIVTAMPVDPVQIAIHAWNLAPDADTMAALRHQWGLDRPLIERYGLWLVRFLGGDWGRSFRTGEPVLQEFAARLPVTLGLGLGGLAAAMVLAIPLGFLAARRPQGVADTASRGLTIFVQAVPMFWFGLVLIWVLAVKLHILRAFDTQGWAMALPVALVALHSIGTLSRVYRRDLLITEAAPFFLSALAKGLSRDAALRRHGHSHALYAMIAAVRSEAGWMIGSAATVEVLFTIPGISQFLIQSIAARDYFVLQAYVMMIAAWMAIMNGAVNLALEWLDPRIVSR